MHPSLSVSAISSFGNSFEEDLALWCDLGIDHVGLYGDKLVAHGLRDAVGRICSAGLQVSSIAALGFALDQPATWASRQEVLLGAVETAAAVNAGCLFVTAGAPGRMGWDECVGALAAALGPVRDHAAASGVALAVEHTNPLRRDLGFIHTLRDMVEVARQLDVGVVVEVTNCWAERDLEATIAAGVATFRVVQVSDYVVGTMTATERAVPGDGDIPLGRIIGAALAAGYSGPFEIEMLGPRIEAEGYRAAIARAVAALDDLLTVPPVVPT